MRGPHRHRDARVLPDNVTGRKTTRKDSEKHPSAPLLSRRADGGDFPGQERDSGALIRPFPHASGNRTRASQMSDSRRKGGLALTPSEQTKWLDISNFEGHNRTLLTPLVSSSGLMKSLV